MTIKSTHARMGTFYLQTDAQKHAPLRRDINAQVEQLIDLIFARKSAMMVRTSIISIATKSAQDVRKIARSVMDINVLEVCQTSQILAGPLVEMDSWL